VEDKLGNREQGTGNRLLGEKRRRGEKENRILPLPISYSLLPYFWLVCMAAFLGYGLSSWGRAQSGRVQCANLVYAGNKSSQCFSDAFLGRLGQVTRIRVEERFRKVRLDSTELSSYPFAVMTGQGRFTLTEKDRLQLRHYLMQGGFLLASAGCSDPQWARSFRGEIGRLFPQSRLERLPLSHPIFRTVYKIDRLDTKKRSGQTTIEALTLQGRVVLVFSPDGLNDTEHAINGCCCCGGDEIRGAEFLNLNILAYCLLH